LGNIAKIAESLSGTGMSITAQRLASGPGWSVDDVVCTAGPDDRPFEEQHDGACIAAVMEGTFQYRSSHGTAVLGPGAVLLGSHGQCFECGHDHGVGDRCLALHFAPDYLESIVAGVPRARTTAFAVPRLPPLPSLMPLIAAAEAAREERDHGELEELAVQFAGAVAAILAGTDASWRRPGPRDERRISRVLRRIEEDAAAPEGERLSLTALAAEAAMSRYHFLRSFRQVVGMTPHQYVLRTRLHRAAVRLRLSDEPVSAVAFDAGFNDLSSFNHRFRRIMGDSPSVYRARRGRGRTLEQRRARNGSERP
jgi:AraC-like DNA-binding protein